MLAPLLLPLVLLPTLVRSEVMTPVPLFDSSHATEGRPFSASLDSTKDGAAASASSLASLVLQSKENVVWAGPKDEHGMATFATMELDSHDTEKIINMQRFSKFLDNVKCGPTSTTLTFTSSDDFTAAVTAWSWVNDHDKHVMHVLANWKGCLTPQGNLQPYHFDKMTSDATSKTITLQGGPKDWSLAAHTFVLEFGGGASGVPDTTSDGDTNTIEGSTSNSSSNATLSKRSQTIEGEAPSLNGSTTDLTTNKTNGVSFKDSKWGFLKKHFRHLGDYNGHKPYDIDIHSDISGKIKPPGITRAGAVFAAQATCTDCHLFGRMDFDLIAKVENWHPVEMGIYATARGVRAQANWNLAAMVSVGFTCCSHHCRSTTDRFRLFTCTIPNLQAELAQTLEIMQAGISLALAGFSFSIPHILHMGLYAEGGYGIRLENVHGEVGIKSTVTGHVNEGAVGHMDVLKRKGSNTNYGVTMTPGKVDFFGSGHGTVIGHAMGGIGIGVSLFKAEYDAVLHMKVPSVGFTLSVDQAGQGECGKQMHRPTASIQPFIDIYIDFRLGGKGAADNINTPIGVADPKSPKSPKIKGRSTKHGSHMLNTDPAEYDAIRAKKVKELARSAIMSGSTWRRNKSNSTATASRTFSPMGPSGSDSENLDKSSASGTDASSSSPSLRHAGDKRWLGAAVKKALGKVWDWTLYYHKYPVGHIMCFPIGHGQSSDKQDSLQTSLMDKGRVTRVVRRGKGSSLVAPVEVERLSLGPATDGPKGLNPTNGTFAPAVQGDHLGV
ncbi:BZ3500_MvSof-1268-A1-R1_Chr4-4g07548 [Microbotryum saponariae]|uniref:BZ3500_MvSof-1268-A1-R1_Chr4-4g07548 protein n=1 Tax=Microbotryum saponariae TaxID=289078 RepID=A0A2X0LMM3_9BASI|nr:BZ3500_MvSof-1268-A1-R1_Chr4-4g07548 [Microbotryum saponariae]SDA07209.1 BZ3501_MvSof-1269-A2-R1_Chr4-3g07256 [Microbotryum saponariae]